MWTRQKVVLTLVNQPPNVGSFIDIVAVFLPNFAEGLNTNGQSGVWSYYAPLSFGIYNYLQFSRKNRGLQWHFGV